MTETASYAEEAPARRSHGLNLPLTTPFKWIGAGFAEPEAREYFTVVSNLADIIPALTREPEAKINPDISKF